MRQPKALRLADLLGPSKAEISIADVWGAAAELRRLHAENAKLNAALVVAKRVIENEYPEDQWDDYGLPIINAALGEK